MSASDAAAAKKQAVSTLKHIAADVAEGNGLSSKGAEKLLANVIDNIVARLTAGEKVRLNGLGTLQVNDRPARMGRNPATGAQVAIPASRKLVFRPAKEVKDTI